MGTKVKRYLLCAHCDKSFGRLVRNVGDRRIKDIAYHLWGSHNTPAPVSRIEAVRMINLQLARRGSRQEPTQDTGKEG